MNLYFGIVIFLTILWYPLSTCFFVCTIDLDLADLYLQMERLSTVGWLSVGAFICCTWGRNYTDDLTILKNKIHTLNWACRCTSSLCLCFGIGSMATLLHPVASLGDAWSAIQFIFRSVDTTYYVHRLQLRVLSLIVLNCVIYVKRPRTLFYDMFVRPGKQYPADVTKWRNRIIRTNCKITVNHRT